MIWLALGVGGLLFRTVHLFFLRDVQTGLVWMLKILTDPFHDLKLYWKAPLALLRGELIDSLRLGLEAVAEIISRRMRRLIDWLVSAGSGHHQPSRSIARAAATKRSATAAKSASL